MKGNLIREIKTNAFYIIEEIKGKNIKLRLYENGTKWTCIERYITKNDLNNFEVV